MARAMLHRVRRLEGALGARPAQAADPRPPLAHAFMMRLAVYPDLFREFGAIAGGSQLGLLDGGIALARLGRLSETLKARGAVDAGA